MKGNIPVLRLGGVEEFQIRSRVNRFVVKVYGNVGESYAYLDNTGRLAEYMVCGRRCYCIRVETPRKTSLTLVAVEDIDYAAVVSTRFQMLAFEEMLKFERIPWLKGFKISKRNVKLGSSKIDYLLSRDGRGEICLEVKSAVMRGEGVFAMYPDCPSPRGRRHIRELIGYVEEGGKAIILFIAALPRVYGFKPNKEVDPTIYSLLREAFLKGVELKSISIYYDPKDNTIYLADPDLPVYL